MRSAECVGRLICIAPWCCSIGFYCGSVCFLQQAASPGSLKHGPEDTCKSGCMLLSGKEMGGNELHLPLAYISSQDMSSVCTMLYHAAATAGAALKTQQQVMIGDVAGHG